MTNSSDLQNLLKDGIAAARAGDKVRARQLLEQVLSKDDNNENAWLWFAMVVDTPREKRICLENVLEINPNNQRAREALARLGPKPAEHGEAPRPAPRSAEPRPSEPISRPTPPAELIVPASGGTVRRGPQDAAPKARPRRRLFSPFYIVVGVLAIAMIGLGIVLLTSPGVVNTPPPETTGLSSATARPVAQVLTPGPTSIQANATVQTPAPLSRTLPPVTLTPSFTPSVTFTPSATIPPPSDYTLAFLGWGRVNSPISIFTIKGDGTGEKAMNPNIHDDVLGFSIAGNGQIAYVASVNGKPELFVIGPRGDTPQQLTSLNGSDLSSPSWSGDNTRLAFSSNDSGNSDIYIINADGSNLVRLTDNKGDDRDPAWAPRGPQIAYSSDVTNQKLFQILIINSSNKEIKQYTNSTGNNTSPVWSPDSTLLAFVSTRDRYPNLYTMSAVDGSHVNLLTYGAGAASSVDPAWTPDGQYIAFTSDRNNKIFNLYLISPVTRTLVTVTANTDPKIKSVGVRYLPGS